ncbi:autotransporter outer membrane beta-barrel domain-containing protein [Stenotrophomonas sp. SI-NJAU-1]|uniref:autotransporter family protein n=1 Tax=Stenotrophomonas sp. SI-NJAU-1 TaxID=2886359 RepID=UPI001E45024A|nr:autotransporter outer membrane beta-barrel domain-containing protein [Stenotrophomonas sp. SI-NJAU-1]UEX18841.1 autotransporter outer membrane beta-barrel domain-containing protein [Stenotrophomonas sp. SI-NJAU-1]
MTRSFIRCLPTRRPLAQSLLLALATLPAAVAYAADLDGQTVEIDASAPFEHWTLVNGSSLTALSTRIWTLTASDTSVIELEDTSVVATGHAERAVFLQGASSLLSRSSSFYGGIHLQPNGASARLYDSRIYIDPFDLSFPHSIGVDISSTASGAPSDNAYALIDSTRIDVGTLPGWQLRFSGLGVRLMAGSMDIVNDSVVSGENVGAFLWAESNPAQRIALTVDHSVLIGHRGAAIRVNAGSQSTYDINVVNGGQLGGGDGNLLLVGNDMRPVNTRTDVNFNVDDSRLVGNITLDSTTATAATINVALRNKAQIDGRFINVTSASIDGDSTWLMTGDSNVGHLALGSTGTVALGNASTFNTLTVDSFDGSGGTLLFNTHLEDDSSATDKLVINGDANGQANVRVLNAGGAGAKTDRGIELIDIGGASNAQFDLVGRAVGGQYEYFLVKDANGNWYLRSQTGAGPDPCVVDPTLPECTPIDPVDPVDPIDPPPPVLRPEAGAYLANQFALDQLLRHGWRDRRGGSTGATDGVRGWARVDATQSKLGAVDDQLDLRVDRSRLQLGADVGVFDNDHGRVGVMGTIAQSRATSRSDLTGYSARGKVEGGALGVYGNWSTDALYVDASVQRGQFRNRVQGEGLAEERYDSDIWQSSVEAGYRFNIGQIGSTALSLQPELQLVYTDAKTDVHTETNGTVVRAAGNSGLSGRAGLRLQGESRSAVGASVSPYLAANWYRDGAGNGIAFDDEVLKAGIPRNRYELSAGARVEFRSGFSAWGGFGVMRGDSGYREATANLSVAYTW